MSGAECRYRIIADDIAGLSPWGRPGPPPRLGLLTEGGLGVPSLHQEAVVDAGPVVWDRQRRVAMRDDPSAPGEGEGQDQQAKVRAMVPMESTS
jgi:hypothetical protein